MIHILRIYLGWNCAQTDGHSMTVLCVGNVFSITSRNLHPPYPEVSISHWLLVQVLCDKACAYPWLYSPCRPWPLFQFLNLYTDGRTHLTGDQPVERPLPTHRTTQTQNKRTQISMPRVGFEPTILVCKQTKTVHALDRASTVIGDKACMASIQ
jgi:hypothetical protein